MTAEPTEDTGTAAMTATAGSASGLKLRAETVEDIMVFSTILQDAVTVTGDMTYRKGERRFAMMVNRYLWEQECGGEKAGNECHRVRGGVHFDDVVKVRTLGLSQRARKKVLELLAVHFVPAAEGAGTVVLLFAGGAMIRLEVECINAYLTDIGEPWPVHCRPSHPVVGQES